VRAGSLLRIQSKEPFILHWARDEWRTVEDTASIMTPLGYTHVDLKIATDEPGPIRFTFRWRDPERWEGRDYAIAIEPA
jgi:glucoamylase